MPFIKLTSSRNTPLYIRRDAVLYVEGFTFEQEPNVGHVGSRLTLIAGQWSESCHALESVETVIYQLSPYVGA